MGTRLCHKSYTANGVGHEWNTRSIRATSGRIIVDLLGNSNPYSVDASPAVKTFMPSWQTGELVNYRRVNWEENKGVSSESDGRLASNRITTSE